MVLCDVENALCLQSTAVDRVFMLIPCRIHQINVACNSFFVLQYMHVSLLV